MVRSFWAHPRADLRTGQRPHHRGKPKTPAAWAHAQRIGCQTLTRACARERARKHSSKLIVLDAPLQLARAAVWPARQPRQPHFSDRRSVTIPLQSRPRNAWGGGGDGGRNAWGGGGDGGRNAWGGGGDGGADEATGDEGIRRHRREGCGWCRRRWLLSRAPGVAEGGGGGEGVDDGGEAGREAAVLVGEARSSPLAQASRARNRRRAA